MSIARAESPAASRMPCMSIARTRCGWCSSSNGPIAPRYLAHFAVPASRDFVRALQPLAAAATTIELYDATRLEKL